MSPSSGNLGSARDAPVGVFDSGVGGLSVLRHVRDLLPAEALLYVADHAWCPYGPRPDGEIRERAGVLTDWLVRQGAKAVVVACNTATAVAVAELRRRHEPAIPIIGMEPAVKPAAAATRNGIVGVLATAGTLASTRYSALLARFAADIEVVSRPSPELVALVEAGDIDSPLARARVAHCLAPLLAAGADTVILGCTHFPPLRPLIEEQAGPTVAVIDTGSAVARQLQRRLGPLGLLRVPGELGSVRVLVTGDARPHAAAVAAVWRSEEPRPESLRL